MKEYISTLYHKNKEIILYLLMGVLTTGVSLGVYYSCVLTILDPRSAIQLQIANIISWVAAVTFAYITNRKYVFESSNSSILREAFAFFLARGGTLVIDMAIMFIGCTLLGFNDKFMKLVVQIVVTISNYVLSKLFVFRRTSGRDGNENQG